MPCSIAPDFVLGAAGRVCHNQLCVGNNAVRGIEDGAGQREEALSPEAGNQQREAEERDERDPSRRTSKRTAIDAGIQHGADSPFKT